MNHKNIILKYTKEKNFLGENIEYLNSKTEYNNNEKIKETEFFKNKYIKSITNYSLNKKHGLYQEYYDNLIIKKEIFYFLDKKHGIYKEWYNNGSVKIDTIYNMDLIDGYYKEFLFNGKQVYNIFYRNGIICYPDTKQKLNSSYTTHFKQLLNNDSEKHIYRYNKLEQKYLYNQFREKIKKTIYYPSSDKIKSEIYYFINGFVKEKKNFNYIGKLDGIQILKTINEDNEIVLKKRIRYKDGKIISNYNDGELVYNDNYGNSLISIPNKELIVWKACLSNDIKTLGQKVMVKLKIPRKSKRLLFINNNNIIEKSRTEYAIVEEIHSYKNPENRNYTEAISFMCKNNTKRIIYKLSNTIYAETFDNDLNNLNGKGIYYCLQYSEAEKYHYN